MTNNEQIKQFAARLATVIDRELGSFMLAPDDQAGVLLAAAHGRACSAGMSPEQLRALAKFIFEMCDQGRQRPTRSLDFELDNLPRKIISGAGGKR